MKPSRTSLLRNYLSAPECRCGFAAHIPYAMQICDLFVDYYGK